MNPRKTLRIARWEVAKHAGGIDRQTVLVAGAGLLLLVALAPTLVSSGVALDDGLYRVGVSESHPLYEPVKQDPTFAVSQPSAKAYGNGNLDILIVGSRADYADSEKGRAAVAELRQTVEAHNDRTMRREANQSAAFPVYPVTLTYQDRDTTELVTSETGDSGDGSGGTSDGSGGTSDGSSGTGDGGGETDDGDSALSVPGLGGDILGTGSASGAPSDIAPPFPFQPLILAFVFVLPLNFVIQAYGSTVLNERINRRGELLLVSPVSRGDIIVGKTLPYFAAAVGLTAGLSLVLGGGALAVAGVVPLAMLFLGATFVGGMFARSYRELTFVTVTVSVLLTTFAFVPAIFADVGSVALISPLTLVVRDLAGTGVSLGGVAFATLPSTMTALLLFGLGAGVYREEDMFTQRPVHLKALDAISTRITGYRSVAVVTALSIPFVFVAELLAVATLFALPGGASIPLVLLAVAVVEELAKGLPAYAGFAEARYPRTMRAGLFAGVAGGLGFFLGEKLTLMVQLVGIPELRTRAGPIGEATFQTGLGGEGAVAALLLLLAPLALHVGTATLSALGASRSRNWWLAGMLTAVGVHIAYNLTVVNTLV